MVFVSFWCCDGGLWWVCSVDPFVGDDCCYDGKYDDDDSVGFRV